MALLHDFLDRHPLRRKHWYCNIFSDACERAVSQHGQRRFGIAKIKRLDIPLHRLDAHSCGRRRNRHIRQRRRLAEAARCNDNGNHHRNQQCRPREDHYHLFYHCMYHIVCVAALIFVGQDSRTSVALCTACSAPRAIPSLRSTLTAFGGYVLIVRRFLYDVAPSAISSAELRLAYLWQS